ncbi:hypothetical protein KL931_004961 [Ogataea haglerorum]|nr:hypothetical protein KL931_004961 [Ogataea haglerorum]
MQSTRYFSSSPTTACCDVTAAAGEPTDEPTQTRPVADSTGALPRRPAFIRQCKVCKINTEKNILIEMATPKYFKVTQLRSAIALPQKKKETLLRLGLRRRHQTVFHRICPEQAGMIATVKELVKVELADEMLTKDEMREQRKSDPGFTIEKAASRTVSTSN